MEMVTDPNLLAELQGGFNAGAPTGAPSYAQPEEEEDSSILGTAWEKMKLQAEGFIAANVENPNLSNYARNRYVSQYNDWKSEHEKLGGVGQFTSDVVGAAPAIAAFASTPVTGVAGLAAGSALSGLQATGDALAAQYEEGRDFDFGSAGLAGAGTAITDLGLAGAGSKLGGMVARKVAAPGAVGITKSIAPVAADIAVADAGSAAASQVYQNLASGRDWSENVGTAALVGGAAGGAVRGAGKGFNGISEKLGIQFNKGGEDAITKATTINRNSGMEANPEFSNSFIDAENATSGVRQRIDEMDIDDPNLGTAITELNTLSNAKAADSAMAELGQMVPDLHMNTKGYDITFKDFQGNERNLGRDVLGMSQKVMDDAATNTSKVTKGMLQSQSGAAEKGITAEAFKQKLHDTYNKKFQEGRGHFGDNLFELEKRMEVAKRSGADNIELQRLSDLHDDLKSFNSLVEKSMKAPSKAEDVHNRIQHISSRIRENAIRTGEAQNLKSFTGKAGEFDPARDFLVFKGLHDSALAQDPSFVYGTTDPLSAAAREKDFNPLNIVRDIAKAPFNMVAQPYRRSKAEASLNAAKDLGRELSARRPQVRVEEALAAGDGAGAARAAVDSLEEAGITVPKAQEAEVAPVAPVTPEPMPEMPVEAPVAPVVEPEVVPSVDAKTRAAPAPKAVEEVVEPTPEPKKRAKAKSKTEPKRKAKEPVAEEGPSPEAVEAAKADLAVALQAAIKGGAKRGEAVQAKSRTAPKEKEVTPEPEVVEEVAPKAPAEPKGRKVPERKVEEPVAKEEPAAVAEEAPAPKPEAKAAKAPKAKEEPVAEEPTQEAPSEARREPLGRKEPTRTEKEAEPVESVTEAPEPKAEPEVEEPKAKPFAKLVREPLEAIVNKPIRASVKNANEMIQARRKAERDLRDLRTLENKFKDNTPEDIARIVHESGGMEGLRAAAEANGVNIHQQTKARLADMEGLRKREAAEKTREMQELLVKKTKPSAPEVDAGAVAKKAQREFDGEMEARGYHGEDVAAVNKAIEDGMSHKNARILAQRLNAERKTTLKEDIKTQKETLDEANAVLKNEGKRSQVDDYLKGMNIEGDKEITEMINGVFKHRSDEVKPKEMQNLLNKIDRHLENQLNEYNSLMRSGGKADPRYPEWSDIANSLRASVSDLKRNRTQVDRAVSKARENASEAATEHAQLVKEYDKLFDQANIRDANANKVVKQKDELVRDLEDKGFTTEEAEAFSNEAFFKRETTPMNEREMQRTINNFVDKKARARTEEVDQKVRSVKEQVSQADDATLVEIGEAVAEEISYSPKMESNDNEVAILKAVSEEMSKRGNKTAQRYKAVAEAMLEGAENRAKFPENPELWMPANTLQEIQKSYGSGDSSYSGRLGVALKLALTGNKDGVRGFGTLDKQVIQSRIKKANESEEGKFLTGMDDLIVK